LEQRLDGLLRPKSKSLAFSLFFAVIYFATLGGTSFEEVVKTADTIPAIAIRF